MSQKIAITEVVRIYNMEVSFLENLEESGLIHPETVGKEKYILFEEIPALERFSNWHYDLEVNIPGLQIIHDLLQKMEILRSENLRLSSFERSHISLWKESETY